MNRDDIPILQPIGGRDELEKSIATCERIAAEFRLEEAQAQRDEINHRFLEARTSAERLKDALQEILLLPDHQRGIQYSPIGDAKAVATRALAASATSTTCIGMHQLANNAQPSMSEIVDQANEEVRRAMEDAKYVNALEEKEAYIEFGTPNTPTHRYCYLDDDPPNADEPWKAGRWENGKVREEHFGMLRRCLDYMLEKL